MSRSKRLSARVAPAGFLRQMSIVSAAAAPLFMASITPEENTGSTKA